MAGSIISKGNGKYKLSYMKDHKRYIKTVTCDNYQEAEVFLASFITDINNGTYVKPCKMTLIKFFEDRYLDYYAYIKLKPETIYRHTQELRHWVFPKVGYIKLCDFTPIIWAGFFSWLSKQKSEETNELLAPATIERIYAVLCSIFTLAMDKWNYIKTNPIKSCRSEYAIDKRNRALRKKKAERCLSYPEAFKLIDALEHEDLKYQLITHFAIVGGLRRSEILGIKWSNVDFDNNTVHITQSSLQTPNYGYFEGSLKTSASYRSLFMPSTTMELLKTYQKITPNTDNDFIFVNNRGVRIGQRLSPSTVTKWFRKFRIKNNLPLEVPLHGLRHTCATILISEGINVTNVSSRLGHSRADTTLNVYSHALTDIDRLACDSIEKLLYENPEDVKIPSSPYTVSNKKYYSKIKLSTLKISNNN